jgi:hypothetical protein
MTVPPSAFSSSRAAISERPPRRFVAIQMRASGIPNFARSPISVRAAEVPKRFGSSTIT